MSVIFIFLCSLYNLLEYFFQHTNFELYGVLHAVFSTFFYEIQKKNRVK